MTTTAEADYTAGLESLYRSHANPVQAGPMAAYMKDQFAFLGLKSPQQAELLRRYLQKAGLPDAQEMPEVARILWALPEREFQYAAIRLLAKNPKRSGPERIELLEELVCTKPWWDTVDLLAGRLIGAHLARYPEQIPEYPDRWIASGHLWLRRSALLYQLSYKGKTDTARLFRYIEACASEKEFFIKKAIGWALRQYARVDGDAVRAFVTAVPLQPLSVREALKHLQPR